MKFQLENPATLARLHTVRIWMPFYPTAIFYTAPDYTYTLSDGNAQIRSYTRAEEVVTIPSTLNGIPVSTFSFRSFAGGKGLTNINVPQGVTTIEANAFADCTGLTNVTIPQGVTSFGSFITNTLQ